MPQSLRARFNGNSQEVVEYTRLWGRLHAMEKYQVKDYIAFSRFIEEATGDSSFGDRPALAGQDHHNWAEELLDAFTTKVLKMETEKRNLEEQLRQAKLRLECLESQQIMRVEPKIQQVMQLCQ